MGKIRSDLGRKQPKTCVWVSAVGGRAFCKGLNLLKLRLQLSNILDINESSHLCINYNILFIGKQNHINRIENFWNRVKRHLCKFNGLSKEQLELSLKECK